MTVANATARSLFFQARDPKAFLYEGSQWQTGFVGGDDRERRKKSGFFVGLVMRATQGQADGRIVNELLARRATEQGS
jgi:Glu-tRNA(Gln) amidotransferase subunit E-like FAD-binding protein